MSPETIGIFALGISIVLAGGIALFGLANVFVASDDVNERLETFAYIPEETTRSASGRGRARLVRLRMRMNALLSIFTSEELGLKLLSANWQITETEFFLIRILGVIFGLALGWLAFKTPISGVGFAIIAYLLPELFLRRSIQRRQRAFERQLVDVLVLANGAVRAGYSFLQALDVVVQEMRAPASEEFRKVRREVSLGLPLNRALLNLHARMENDDLYLVVTAVIINSQVGGNLATMLDAVTNTIRERVRLFSEIRALTSQQRYSSYLLTVLPFLVAGVLFILNPDYMKRMFVPGITLCIPIGAVIMVILGNIAIRIISRIDV